MALSKTVKVNIGEQSYEVKYPNIGELLDIETKKAALANNMYGSLSLMNNHNSVYALDLIDMLAYFITLIPKLKDNLQGYNSILELSPIEAKPLLKAYKEEFLPWFEEWDKVINSREEEEEIKESN